MGRKRLLTEREEMRIARLSKLRRLLSRKSLARRFDVSERLCYGDSLREGFQK